jgi:hypothetical protein
MKKIKILLLPLLLLFFSCLTTNAILRNKTILSHKGSPMSKAGINWGYPNKGREEFEIYDDLGIEWFRLDYSWDKLEKEPGVWTFDDTDYFTEQAKQRGYKILGVLAFDNPWVHEDPEGLREIPMDRIDDFLNYVEVVVTHYKGQVDEWEIWNEPNLPFRTFWTGSDEDFFTLNTAVAKKIKEIDPQAVVLGGALWRFDKGFTKDMYQSGSLENIDVFSYHPYYDKPEKIYDKSRDLEDYLKLLGFPGDYRVTEVGFNTYGRLPTSCSPEEQGRLVLETLVLLGSMKHPYIIWYNLYNGTIKGKGLWNDNYGILIKDNDTFVYKTGGWAFRRYNELIAGKFMSRDKIIVEEGLEKK